MRKIYSILSIMLLALGFGSCSSDDPFETISPNDSPRILSPVFPDRENGQLATFYQFSRDGSLNSSLIVTPSHYSTVKWYIDGEEVATGTNIDLPLAAGTYTLRIVVSTSADSTYREGLVKVSPLDGDPYSEAVGNERIIAPSSQAVLYGSNLQDIKSVKIGSNTIAVDSASEDKITYTLPADIDAGEYRVLLVNDLGEEYGANTLRVTTDPMVISGAERVQAGGECTLIGVNLENVAQLNFGGHQISTFLSQTNTQLVFRVPDLEDGNYELTGTAKDGTAVIFIVESELTTETSSLVTSDVTLWEGHHYVSWNLDDSSPNKTFNLISKEVFAGISAGSTLTINYSVEPADEYHQIRTTTGWWNDLAGTSVKEFTTDGSIDVLLTQEVLDQIQQQDGFLCVGHGYYVDLITVK